MNYRGVLVKKIMGMDIQPNPNTLDPIAIDYYMDV